MKEVVILVPTGNVTLSCITGAYQILRSADAYWQKLGNRSMMNVSIAGFMPEQKLEGGYFSVHPQNIADISNIDLLVIPATPYHADLFKDNIALIDRIKEEYKNGAEIACMCSGAFLLAATGLLDGKRCSIHWNAADNFKRLFPETEVVVDKLITSERGIYTNGGAFSFLNFVLFLVEKYFDRQTAIFCSKMFQIDMDRTSQSPFYIFEAQKHHGDELVIEAQTYIEEHLDKKVSFEELASKLATSRRNFDRRFIKATGNTPVEYLQRVKIEVAKKALEKGRKSIYEVMDEVGYADDKAFREVFKKITGLSPLDYKAKYSVAVDVI